MNIQTKRRRIIQHLKKLDKSLAKELDLLVEMLATCEHHGKPLPSKIPPAIAAVRAQQHGLENIFRTLETSWFPKQLISTIGEFISKYEYVRNRVSQAIRSLDNQEKTP